ncbi:MAG: non-ribosomal peptide synthetase, partial [Comamonadaceae bacterium]
GTVARWGGYFVRVLEAMVRDDALRVADIPLIEDAERTLLLERFNAAPAADAPAALVHTLFEEQAARSPDAIALVAAGRNWRYAELDRAANRLAHRLRGHGVGPDARVALYVQRGADMVVGVLAALKAGGCYLPLDPADPPERIAGMLADAAPRVVLTHAALQAALPASSAQVLVLDTAGAAADDAALPVPARAAPAVTPQHLAYVIYTSGSTGVPKGVAMPHAPLANLIRWQCRQGPAARTLQFAAIGFDVAFQEMFSTLCAGGTLVIADETARRDPEALARLVQAEAIERLFLPFIALEHLAQWLARQPEAMALPALRQVITAGEQLRIGAELRHMFALLPGCRLHNHYGPTETHVVTAEVLDADPAQWPVLPSIGRPVDGARIYVLDAQGQPVPLGVAGELHVGGVALARGYLERA